MITKLCNPHNHFIVLLVLVDVHVLHTYVSFKFIDAHTCTGFPFLTIFNTSSKFCPVIFFIPFLISNCHKIPQNTKRDDTKIEQVKNKILENYEHSKQTSSGNSIIEKLKFNDSILDFGCYDKVTDVIFDFNIFYSENKRYFKFLCDFDFSKADECEKAKSEFKT